MEPSQIDAESVLKRRGSGISIALSQHQKAASKSTGMMDKVGFQDYEQWPGYMQAGYPILINPPNMPTYHYGIPPSPMPMSPYLPPQHPIHMQRMQRKSMYGPSFDGDYGEKHEDFARDMSTPNLARPEQVPLYLQYQKNMQTSSKIEQLDKNPYPGVIIEEMLDSASVCAASVKESVKMEKPDDAVSLLGSEPFRAPSVQKAQVRLRHTTPINTMVMFVPQQEAWVVERMGKFYKILDPGMNFLIPVLDKVKYVQSLKEIAIDIPSQSAITIEKATSGIAFTNYWNFTEKPDWLFWSKQGLKVAGAADNVTLNIDGVLYLRIRDPYKASYGVEDPEFAITQLAQTTMRSEIGKITLDTLFRERDNLNTAIIIAINQASEDWGMQCMRYEIRDIQMSSRVQEAMQMQVEAERKKRAAILESEGIKTAEINVAEGKKQSMILQSEAEMQQIINEAEGAAQAVVAAGKARAESIEMVAKALNQANGSNAASLAVAEKYVTAFGELAKTNNTLMLPANTGDVSAMVAQAMGIYNQLKDKQPQVTNEVKPSPEEK